MMVAREEKAEAGTAVGTAKAKEVVASVVAKARTKEVVALVVVVIMVVAVTPALGTAAEEMVKAAE